MSTFLPVPFHTLFEAFGNFHDTTTISPYSPSAFFSPSQNPVHPCIGVEKETRRVTYYKALFGKCHLSADDFPLKIVKDIRRVPYLAIVPPKTSTRSIKNKKALSAKT
jgi:hypothetical protein